MKEYQWRVIDEKNQLDARAEKLSDYIGNHPDFEAIGAEEQERMKVQNDLMWQLSEVLGERIKAFDQVEPAALATELIHIRANVRHDLGGSLQVSALVKIDGARLDYPGGDKVYLIDEFDREAMSLGGFKLDLSKAVEDMGGSLDAGELDEMAHRVISR